MNKKAIIGALGLLVLLGFIAYLSTRTVTASPSEKLGSLATIAITDDPEVECTNGAHRCRDNAGGYQESQCYGGGWGPWYNCCANCNCGPGGPNGECTLAN